MPFITLDIRTLSFITAGIALLFAAGLALFAHQQRKYRGIAIIAAANAVTGTGCFLIGFRDFWPDAITIVLANQLVIWGSVCYFEGTRRFLQPARHVHPVSLAAVAFGIGLFLYFTYHAPSVKNRVLVITAIHLLMSALTARELWFHPGACDRWRLPETATGIVFIGYGLFQLMRFVWTSGAGPIPSFMSAGHIHALAFLSVILLVSGSTFGHVWMVGRRLEQELVEISHRDPLTRLLNRRGFAEMAIREFAKQQRGSSGMAVVVIDIDDFKQINDRCGHDAGDRVIVHVAESLHGGLRPSDILGRLGGDEFILLLPETTSDEALGIAERLRTRIEEHPIGLKDGRQTITASFGVARITSPPENMEGLIQPADEALYRAKQQGKNRIVCLDFTGRTRLAAAGASPAGEPRP